MDSLGEGLTNSILHVRGRAHFLRITALVALGIVMALVAFGALGQQPAHAAGLVDPGKIQSVYASNGELPTQGIVEDGSAPAGNPKVISPADPAILGARGNWGCGRPPKPVIPIQPVETVWSANMVVGEASDPTVTYLGYAPPLSPDGGALDVTSFSHDGMDYTVTGLFLQEAISGFRQLVFDAGARLPDDLILKVGKDEFLVSESALYGIKQNIHGWVLDASLGWTEGQVIELELMEPVEGDGN